MSSASARVARELCDHGLVEVDKVLEASDIESRGYGMHIRVQYTHGQSIFSIKSGTPKWQILQWSV